MLFSDIFVAASKKLVFQTGCKPSFGLPKIFEQGESSSVIKGKSFFLRI
jgi:hypothetical protein